MTTGRSYKNSDDVKARILAAGVALWPNASTHAIGRAIGLTHSAVRYHFGSGTALNEAIARHAVAIGNSAVIVQLIGAKHDAVAALSDADRARHLSACGV